MRFPAPIRVGARVRGRGHVAAARALEGGGIQVTVRVSVEIDGQDKPGCVVDTISRLQFE